mgnify:CR=1 FL=1
MCGFVCSTNIFKFDHSADNISIRMIKYNWEIILLVEAKQTNSCFSNFDGLGFRVDGHFID